MDSNTYTYCRTHVPAFTAKEKRKMTHAARYSLVKCPYIYDLF